MGAAGVGLHGVGLQPETLLLLVLGVPGESQRKCCLCLLRVGGGLGPVWVYSHSFRLPDPLERGPEVSAPSHRCQGPLRSRSVCGPGRWVVVPLQGGRGRRGAWGYAQLSSLGRQTCSFLLPRHATRVAGT